MWKKMKMGNKNKMYFACILCFQFPLTDSWQVPIKSTNCCFYCTALDHLCGEFMRPSKKVHFDTSSDLTSLHLTKPKFNGAVKTAFQAVKHPSINCKELASLLSMHLAILLCRKLYCRRNENCREDNLKRNVIFKKINGLLEVLITI